jgi:hypothetical protein
MAFPTADKYNKGIAGIKDSAMIRRIRSRGGNEMADKISGAVTKRLGELRDKVVATDQRAVARDQKRGMLDAFARKIEEAQGPTKLQAEAGPQSTSELQGFEAMRRRTEQRANAAGQTNLDALKRRLAAAGVLNSGAGIEAMQQAMQQSAQAKADAVQGVEFEGQQQLTQQQEAVKSRNLVREQANSEAEFQDKVFRADTKSRIFQLGQNIDQLELQDLQLELAREEQEFNKMMAQRMANQGPDIGDILGGVGSLAGGVGGLLEGIGSSTTPGKKK